MNMNKKHNTMKISNKYLNIKRRDTYFVSF